MIPRVFAMPSHDTLSVPAMKGFAQRYLLGDVDSVDPFARNCRLASVTNDLNPETAAQYHMDALDFCALLEREGRVFDVAIYDPPYSPRQVSECYNSVGRECTMHDTQSSFWTKSRDALDRIIRPGGIVISFGWNTNGMGKKRGYEIVDLLLVAHGGAHNDTICIAERKLARPPTLFGEAA